MSTIYAPSAPTIRKSTLANGQQTKASRKRPHCQAEGSDIAEAVHVDGDALTAYLERASGSGRLFVAHSLQRFGVKPLKMRH